MSPLFVDDSLMQARQLLYVNTEQKNNDNLQRLKIDRGGYSHIQTL